MKRNRRAVKRALGRLAGAWYYHRRDGRVVVGFKKESRGDGAARLTAALRLSRLPCVIEQTDTHYLLALKPRSFKHD